MCQNVYSAGVMPLARKYISAEARWCVVWSIIIMRISGTLIYGYER